MSYRPPIPTGNTQAARWFKWFQDEINSLKAMQACGAYVRRTSRGTIIDFQKRGKTAPASGIQFDSFGFGLADYYVLNTGALVHFAVSVQSTLNCSVGSLPVNWQPLSLLPSAPARQPLPTTCTVTSGFSFETIWRHGATDPADNMPSEIILPARASFRFSVPSGLRLNNGQAAFLWGRVKS